MKKWLVVDGNSIVNRAFYGIHSMSTHTGIPTNALYGMMKTVSGYLEDLKPDYAAVAFDLKAPTFRHKLYPEYKAGRHATPDDLVPQLAQARDLCRAMGLCVLEEEGYEADDMLGTLSRMAADAGDDCYVVTGDRDSLQLIDEHVHVMLHTKNEVIDYTPKRFREDYGIDPSQFIYVKALMGDSSDNIPGVPKVGDKTALRLISSFGTLDGVYRALEAGDASITGALRTNLENGKDSAYLSFKLVVIDRQVPLSQKTEDLAYGGPDRKKLLDLCLHYEFSSFVKKMNLDVPDPEQDAGKAEEEPARRDKEYEEAVLPAKDLAKVLEGADEAGFSYDGTSAWFYAKGVLYRPEEKDMKSLEALLNGKLPPLTVHDCKTLYKRLEQDGIRWRDASFDVMLAAYVLQSGENDFSLQKLTVSYLHEVYDDTVPDAVYAQRLRAPMEEELEKTGQASVLADIEMPTAAVLADMELSGFKVDVDGIRSYGELLKRSAEELSQRIYLQAGTEFNILSPKQLGEVLFEKLGLPGGKKTKTGYSTNADVLQKLRFSHDIVDDILDYRQVTKLYSTYVEGLVNLADAQGRIHTTFNQTGTATGRLSSAEPNLQNIPVRTELGRELRKYFVAKDSDHVLIDADYSQIELRIMAHAANDGHMIDAFRSGEDIHTMTAARVFHRLPEQVTPDLRKRAKAINFGIIYGIGGHSLGEDLGISTAKATQYIEEYKSSYPGIDNYLKETVEKARKDGYVRTMFGRRRYIPELRDTNKNIQHFGERVAMNSPIQGAAADIIKMAMVRVHRELESSGIDAKIILQVHDELILESAKDCADKAMEILVREMERTVDLRVPLVADAHTGDNWFDAK